MSKLSACTVNPGGAAKLPVDTADWREVLIESIETDLAT